MKQDDVYILKAGPFIKVGISSALTSRLSVIQTGCPYPVELVRTIIGGGGRYLEGILHQQLSEHHSHGEWFHYNDATQEILKELDAAVEKVLTAETKSTTIQKQGSPES